MNALQALDMEEHLQDPLRKQHYVNAVFDTVADSYDRFTRLCSFGMDMAWKRDLVRLVKSHVQPHHVVVDLATGTGDLALALAGSVRRGRVIGIDIAERMIQLAERARRARKITNVEFRMGDLMSIDQAAASVDAVTVSYGLRNCPDYRAGLAEIQRVLRSGGLLAALDFVRPANPLWEFVFQNSLQAACNFYGWLWHRQPAAYGYLAQSIRRFATNREFTEALCQEGFELLEACPKLGGAVYLYVARKLPVST